MSTIKSIKVEIINAFVDNGIGGNPAGVVLNADNLSNQEKLLVASKVGLSETVFVSKSKKADYKLDFFTPTRQIAHCGHATIATFSYLSQLGLVKTNLLSKETIDGNRKIFILNEETFMEQIKPTYTTLENSKLDILKSLGIFESDLLPNSPISIVDTGNNFAIIPVLNMNILKNLKPNFNLITKISEEHDLIGYYVFCTQTNCDYRDATTRMFAPRYGIEEEAATGMAAGPLVSYLYDKLGVIKKRYYIEQGWFMKHPSPSLILVDLIIKNKQISKIMAGGKGILMNELKIEV